MSVAATSAPAGPPTPVPRGGAAATARGGDQPDAFARALQRRQATDAAPSAPSDTTGTGSEASSPDAAEPDAGASMPAASGVDVPVAVDIQPPAPGWPPVGLAGLLGFAAAPGPMATSDDAQAMPPPGGLPPGPVAQPVPTPQTTAPMLAEVPVGDAAVPAAGLLPEPATMAEGGEPAPVAFTLPAPVALREPPPLLAAPLPTPEVGADDFEARFGAQIEWMASQKLSEARIRVTPNDLGPVEVRLHLDGDRIRADFVSANAETRQALEQGLPRLRDLLGEHGFQLAHAGVGAGGSDARGGATSTAANSGDGSGTGAAEAPPATPQRRSLGLLDAYA